MTTGENFWLQIQSAISGSVAAAVAMAGVSKAAVVVIIVRKVLIVVKK